VKAPFLKYQLCNPAFANGMPKRYHSNAASLRDKFDMILMFCLKVTIDV
jgi:hypothetical protein